MMYKFEISYYSESENKDIEDCGLVFGRNYGEAMEALTKEYDETGINFIKLDWWNGMSRPIVYCDKEHADSFWEANEF